LKLWFCGACNLNKVRAHPHTRKSRLFGDASRVMFHCVVAQPSRPNHIAQVPHELSVRGAMRRSARFRSNEARRISSDSLLFRIHHHWMAQPFGSRHGLERAPLLLSCSSELGEIATMFMFYRRLLVQSVAARGAGAAVLACLFGFTALATRHVAAFQTDLVSVGPGIPNVGSLAPRSGASSSKAGSILFFHKYTSNTAQLSNVNTVFTLTNANPRDGIALRLSWIHACSVDTTFMTLGANQTKTFTASDANPNQTGYLMVMAVSATGVPLQFNWLLGTAAYKDARGFEVIYNAVGVAKRSGGWARTDAAITQAEVNFDNTDYDRLPKSIAVDNLQNQSAAVGGDAQTKTDVMVYSPLVNLATLNSQGLKYEAVAYDLSGRPFPLVLDSACGLTTSVGNVWTNINEFITPTRQGWARFGANSNNISVPVLGMSLTEGASASDTRRNGRPMQVLSWLDSFKMTVPLIAPTAGAPSDPVTQSQPEAVGGALGTSEMKTGSVLLYNRFAAGIYGSTRLSLTNTHPSQRARVRLFFSGLVEPSLVNETIIILQPSQTSTFNAQDFAPNQKGWVMAVAIDGRAQMTQHNFLIGSAVVSEQTTGVTTGYNALAVAKNSTGVVARNEDGMTANVRFNDEVYDRLPATLALNGVQNQTDVTTFFGFGRPPASMFDAPNTRGLINVTMYDQLLAAASAVVGTIETRLGLIRANAQTPPIATTIQRGQRGWMKITSSVPLLAWHNGLANTRFTVPATGGNWTGGFFGGGNVHTLTTANDYILRAAANNPNNRPPVAEFESIPAEIEARSGAGVNVRLDGRISHDPDGEDDPLSFKWFDNGVEISTAKVTDYKFKVGSHLLKLVVLDGNNTPSEPNEYLFYVVDRTPPKMSGVPTEINKVSGSAAGLALSYTLPYAWDYVAGRVSVTASKGPGSVFPIGRTIVIFKARDNEGNESTATMEVNITKGLATLPTRGGVPSNKLPEIRTPNDQYVLVNKTKTLNLVANDEDGDPVTFQLTGAPPYARIDAPDPVTRTAKLIIEPRPGDQVASTIVRIIATDNKGGQATTLPFRIQISDFETVENGDGSGPGGPPDPGTGVGGGGGGGGGTPINKPPVAAIKPLPPTIKATSKQGGVVNLDGSGSTDPDLDPLTYEWKANGVKVGEGPLTAVTLPVGTHAITLTVSDGKGGTSTAGPVSVEILPRDLTITSASPARIGQFNQLTITVTGTGFNASPDLALQTKLRFDCTSFCSGGSQITVTITSIEEDKIVANIRTTAKTPLGNRDAIVTNANGISAKLSRSNYVAP
jgi:hypothetical protein